MKKLKKEKSLETRGWGRELQIVLRKNVIFCAQLNVLE